MSMVKELYDLLRGTTLHGATNPVSDSSEEADARTSGGRYARGNVAIGVEDAFVTERDLDREREENRSVIFP